MMSLLRNNKILIVVLAAAAAAAAFWFGVLAPKRQEATALDGKISAKQGELAQAQAQMVTYQKARAAYKSVYSRVVQLGKAVPGDDDVRSLIVQLDSVSGKSRVNFAKVDVGGSSAGATTAPAASTTTTSTTTTTPTLAPAPGLVPIGSTGVSALPFSLTFEGRYLQLSDLFTRLQHFVDVRNDQIKVKGRLLRIESFSIQPAATGWPAMSTVIGAASYVTTPVAAPAGASGGTGTTPSTGTTPASSGGTTTPSTTTATATGVAR
jgi:hypothetical protein